MGAQYNVVSDRVAAAQILTRMEHITHFGVPAYPLKLGCQLRIRSAYRSRRASCIFTGSVRTLFSMRLTSARGFPRICLGIAATRDTPSVFVPNTPIRRTESISFAGL